MKKTKQKQKKNYAKLITEFAKLQLAGNIPFWGTLLSLAFFTKVLGWSDEISAYAAATVLANTLFFIVDDKWVFTDGRAGRKSHYEIIKFIIFMSFSAFLNFSLTYILYTTLDVSLYIGQFISAAVFTLWTFFGLRFWVFAPPRHHGLFAPKQTTKSRRKTA